MSKFSSNYSILMYILFYNKDLILDFNKKNIMDLIKLYPKQLLQVDKFGKNPLMYILEYNKTEELRLTREDILNIINLYPEQLLQVDSTGWNPLMYILSNNKYQELGLKSNDIIDIINLYPEQLLQVDKEGWNPLMFILANNKIQELGLSMEYINKLYEEQIDKEYSYIDKYNKKQTILFNEEYIKNNLTEYRYDKIYFQEFLDYRKSLLEKQKINNALEIKQNKKENFFSSNIKKI